MPSNASSSSWEDPPRLPESDAEERSRDTDETLADHDQTLADHDQTLADHDQTLSARDQRASDEEQAASDSDLEGGGDPVTHARSTAMRGEAKSARRETEALRDATALERDGMARERDELAARRDHYAATCDEEALELDSRDELVDRRGLRAKSVRVRAAEARKRAARDRELAARDREHLAHELDRAGLDELTAARRRGVGLQEFKRDIQRARRTHSNLVAVYVDVDGLKSVNDERGHTAGDELLRNVVDGLRSQLRSYDLVVRLGGDEFLCSLPGVTLAQARRRFDELVSQLSDDPAGGSMSFGLSELRDGESEQELIDRADKELLATRRDGR
jgi:diguanylate cyclase (GGDEF)-like protein